MSTLEGALVEAGLGRPLSVDRRIWEHIKAHPSCTTSMIAQALALEKLVVRGHAAVLVQKKLLSSQRVQRWDDGKLRDVHEFSVTLSEYRDLPLQRRPRGLNRKTLERQRALAEAAAQMANAAAPPPGPNLMRPTAELRPSILIEQLTLQEAHALYQQLRTYFDSAAAPAKANGQ